jgi:hypothetical protein
MMCMFVTLSSLGLNQPIVFGGRFFRTMKFDFWRLGGFQIGKGISDILYKVKPRERASLFSRSLGSIGDEVPLCRAPPRDMKYLSVPHPKKGHI